uniref:PPM-type phosphatase domain-containing protein n=1 Tax=Magnetococcus massalia (strain MO-1) TaxID=451514 RepID=A0A1S7LJ30_MAGMO|nr:protein of unknown function [Candidatus Magnetococcus massalia]
MQWVSVQVPTAEINQSLGEQNATIWSMHVLSLSLLTLLSLFFAGKLRNQWLFIANAKQQQEVLVAERTADLQKANDRLQHERDLVESVINQIRMHPSFDPAGQRILATSVDKTNGDMVLAMGRADGNHYFLVGDFTGHGLGAAVCGPLVSNIFYILVMKGEQPETILQEINQHLCDHLPPNLYLAGCLVEKEARTGRLTLWNFGLPELPIFKNGAHFGNIQSGMLPLGIMHDLELESYSVLYDSEEDMRIYLATDGIIETSTEEGEMFGEKRLLTTLEALITNRSQLNQILGVLEVFRGEKAQEDDITLVEISMPKLEEVGIR